MSSDVRVLIIEDDQMSIDVLQYSLQLLNITTDVILHITSIEEQLAAVPRPNIVFLDLEMPGHSGYDVLQIIRRNPDFTEVPIIAYTTHLSHINDVRNAGFDGFLGKPVDNDTFPQTIQRILNGEAVWEIHS